MSVTYNDKLQILIALRMSTPEPNSIQARKDLIDSMLKETPQLKDDLERFEKANGVWLGGKKQQKIKIPIKDRLKKCSCGYEWLARTANPVKCPNCQKPMENKQP